MCIKIYVFTMKKYFVLYTIYICDLSKKKRTFFVKHLLISLQLNKTCRLQSTALHCLYTASNALPVPERVLQDSA
jgi:hypothetical protein